MIPWAQLNREQAEVVRAVDERLLVLAPVGTGKTNVLALRAAHAIERGWDARELLCLSFTNKAALEMTARLTQVLAPAQARQVVSRTFHGLCASILREEAATLGLDGDFLIYDEEDCRSLWGQVLAQAGVDLPPGGQERNELEFFYFDAGQRARLTKWDDRPPRRPEQVFEDCARQRSRLVLPRGASASEFHKHLRAYMHALRENHALDFADLIDGVNRLFSENAGALARWRNRFRWIQVDEVQDTNLGEYRVIALLAAGSERLTLFGDIDQAIYEWRGSDPDSVLERFRQEFAPVHEIHLQRNYRSTQAILSACERLIRALPGAHTRRIQAEAAETGEPVEFFEAENLEEEAEWIARRVEDLRRQHALAYRQCAVLTRTNFTARDLSRQFSALRLPHVQVDEFKFFQRMEVKDAMAHLRLVLNPADGQALDRFLVRPAKGIGETTLEQLRGPAKALGLRLGDLLNLRTHETGDPFAPLLQAAAHGNLVVFDLETTGTDRVRDEIVEIAAQRFGSQDTFQTLVQPRRPVGASVAVHHLTDEMLAREGRPFEEALEAFAQFAGGAVLAGHNAATFDLPFLALAAERAGSHRWSGCELFDTLDLSRRFYRLPRYRLDSLAQHFGFAAAPTHRALADVQTTCELLGVLLRNLQEKEQERRDMVAKYAARFQPLAGHLARWRERAQVERPHELLLRVLDESGLAAYYEEKKNEPQRVENLKRLARLMEYADDPSLSPWEALRQSLQLAALGQDSDQLVMGEDRVALLTAHQAKGLEFEAVFIAQACEDEFPSFQSRRDGRLAEEHRLFYVAATRARRWLQVSWSRWRARGRKGQPSRYLAYLRADS